MQSVALYPSSSLRDQLSTLRQIVPDMTKVWPYLRTIEQDLDPVVIEYLNQACPTWSLRMVHHASAVSSAFAAQLSRRILRQGVNTAVSPTIHEPALGAARVEVRFMKDELWFVWRPGYSIKVKAPLYGKPEPVGHKALRNYHIPLVSRLKYGLMLYVWDRQCFGMLSQDLARVDGSQRACAKRMMDAIEYGRKMWDARRTTYQDVLDCAMSGAFPYGAQFRAKRWVIC